MWRSRGLIQHGVVSSLSMRAQLHVMEIYIKDFYHGLSKLLLSIQVKTHSVFMETYMCLEVDEQACACW